MQCNEMEAAARVRDLFAEDLVDLGAEDARFRGIVTPRSEHHAEKRGVTSQFLEHAAEYDRQYSNVAHFRTLIDNALAVLRPLAPRTILDIGSGSGNSVIPLLDRFPDAFVVATDISPQLLAILRDYLEGRSEYRGRYALVCMDACNDRYRAGVFDLAVGAAILHHVLEPERVVRACERALAPGGARHLLRTLCDRHGVLALAYDDIASEAFAAARIRAALARCARSARTIRRARATGPIPRSSRSTTSGCSRARSSSPFAHRGEWAECHVVPIHGDATPLTDQTRNSLALAGASASELPAWAFDVIARYETAFAPEARRELVLECAVIMRTAGHERIAHRAGSGWWWNPSESGRGFFFERRDGLGQLVCCAYEESGEPVWYGTELAAARRAKRYARTLDPVGVSRAPTVRSTLRFASTAVKRTCVWTVTSSCSSPSTRRTRASRVPGDAPLTGVWLEDAETPEWAAVVELVGDHLVAAVLSPVEWILHVGVAQRAPLLPRRLAALLRRTDRCAALIVRPPRPARSGMRASCGRTRPRW